MVDILHYNRETGNNVAFILAARDHRLIEVRITHVRLEVDFPRVYNFASFLRGGKNTMKKHQANSSYLVM